LWSAVEEGVGITCASAPVLKAFVSRLTSLKEKKKEVQRPDQVRGSFTFGPRQQARVEEDTTTSEAEKDDIRGDIYSL